MDDGTADRDDFAPAPWLREHGSAIALLLLAAAVTAGLLLAPKCVRRDGPPAAPAHSLDAPVCVGPNCVVPKR